MSLPHARNDLCEKGCVLTQAFWGLGKSYCKCKVFVNNPSVLSTVSPCGCVTELLLVRPGLARALRGGPAPSCSHPWCGVGGSSPAQGKQPEQRAFQGWNTNVLKAAEAMARNRIEKGNWQRWSTNPCGFVGGTHESALPGMNPAYAKACSKAVTACVCMCQRFRDVSLVLLVPNCFSSLVFSFPEDTWWWETPSTLLSSSRPSRGSLAKATMGNFGWLLVQIWMWRWEMSLIAVSGMFGV